MDSTALESTETTKFECLIGENYQLRLNESLKDFAAEIQKETPNFSYLADVFYELVQARIDPPLESIWVYSALSFRSHNCLAEDPLSRLSVVKDLFQFVSACSSSCNSSKSIAVLAPIVLKVYELAAELLRKDFYSKGEKKAMKEVNSLIESIICYINICCSNDFSEESNASVGYINLALPVSEMVSFWSNSYESLESFFPLVSRGICREISERGSNVNYLAGIVMIEVLLLKLCLNLSVRAAGIEVENELRSWVVGSVTGFRSIYFFEILLRMLLEPTLPGTSLFVQKSEQGSILRNILYDAAILVEYSFFNSVKAVDQSTEQMRDLALTRLIVTHGAIEFFRVNGDQKRALAYSSAFSSSRLPFLLTKCITSQVGMDEKPVVSSPKALIKWLLNLEKQGIKVFHNSLLKFHAKSALDKSNADHRPLPSMLEERKIDDELVFYVDKGEGLEAEKEEEEDEDEDEDDDEDKRENVHMTAAFVAAAHDMKSTESKAKKRKGSSSTRREEFKYGKYDLPDLSFIRDRISADNNDSSSDSEVENPLSDEDEGRE